MLSPAAMEQIKAAVAAQGAGAGEHVLTFSQRAVPFAVQVGVQRSGAAPVQRAEPTPQDGGDAPADAGGSSEDGAVEFKLVGTASSTSVDWYGTEMSRACLSGMAEQFRRGVEVFVGHGSMFDTLEWDKSIGITTGAEIKDAAVVDPADPTEPGAVCTVEMTFAYNAKTPASIREAIDLLRSRIERGLRTGLSIGGWFRRMVYVTDAEGNLTRIIVEQVDLDHLATTRSPANPDCLDLAEMRSVLGSALSAQRAAQPATRSLPAEAPAPSAPAARELDPKEPRLEDSEYEQPPHDYVTDIKANWPDIWEAGGNIRGNDAYRLWSAYLEGDRSEEVLDWVVEREGWAARHFEDFELPGVMAQLKWGVIGSRGWDHQKQVIEDRKAEMEAEDTEDEASVEDGAGKSEADRAEPSSEPEPTAPDASPEPSTLSSPDSPAESAGDPSPDTRADSAQTDNPETRDQETHMTPEQIQALVEAGLAAALRKAGLGAEPASDTLPPQTLDDAQRRGQAPTPPAAPAIQAPAGADLTRSRNVRSMILHHRTFSPESSDKTFQGEILRAVHFGETEVDSLRAAGFREPSGQRTKGLWLGLAHELRSIGAETLADIAERAAPVLAVDLRGARALRQGDAQLEADRNLVDTEARALFVEAVRAAAADGHPTYKEPGTREAATRALTVSATSDKVTTALVSSLLQQLSNVQLGARTQLRRIPGAGTAYQTPKRTVSNTLAEFVADGSAPTEDSGSWGYDTWNYRTLATRIKVTRKAIAQGRQWGDILAAEALYKGEDFNKQEEVAIFQGDNANSLPTANAFNGLLTLIGANSGQTVANTTATAGDVLSTKQLDLTISKVRGRENKANLRIFASERGHILLNTVLQADQQFVNQVMIQAGFVVQTYAGIPIVESSGIPDTLVWNGTDTKVTKWTTGATTAIVVANLNHVYMVVLTPMMLEQVGTTTAQYAEYEMYCDEVLVLDNSYGAALLGGIKVE